MRLFQTDSSYVSFGDIYDLHCEENSMPKEEPVLHVGEKVKKVLREFRQSATRQVRSPNEKRYYWQLTMCLQLTKTEFITLKKELFEEVAIKLVPEDILTKVRWPILASLWSLTLYFSVHDANHVGTFGTMEDAKAICFTDRIDQLYDICPLSLEQASSTIPSLSSHWTDRDVRTFTRFVD